MNPDNTEKALLSEKELLAECKPLTKSLVDMDLDKNDMNAPELTAASSNYIPSDQSLSLSSDSEYHDSFYSCTKRLMKNCFIGLFVDSVRSGVLTINT